MKTGISMGLMLLLASCATPQKPAGTHAGTVHRHPHDTLRPRLVAVASSPERLGRESRPGYLPGEYRNYGLAEMPAPIASTNAPTRTAYRPPAPPRRVINQVTNDSTHDGATALPPSATEDISPSGSYRSVINQITNQPLGVDPAPVNVGAKQTVINGVNNDPVPTSPAPFVPPKSHAQRTVIEPIGNTPVQ